MNELSAIVVSMPLDALVLETELQPRELLDRTTWEEYLYLLGDGTVLPPVIAFFDGETNWLADGYHRWHAHKALGSVAIDVQVMRGTRDDALRYSLRANAAHGKRREQNDYTRSYKIAIAHGFVRAEDVAAVQDTLQCSMRWAYDLTQLARDKAEADRDAEIAEKKAAGQSNRAIARDVGVNEITVRRKTATSPQPAKMSQEPAPPIPGQAFYDGMTSPAGERWWGALRALEKVGEQASVKALMEDQYDGIPASVFDPALRGAHAWINELYRRYFDE